MKTFLTILVSTGVIIILGLTAMYPFPFIYDFTLVQMENVAEPLMMDRSQERIYCGNSLFGYSLPSYLEEKIPFDTNLFRAKIMLLFTPITLIQLALMFLLRKATKSLNLSFFKRVLTGAMFYSAILTILMFVGMWLHFVIDTGGGSYAVSVGFVFYSNAYLTF